jgi:hypothetical protein
MISLSNELVTQINRHLMLESAKYKKNINILVKIRNGSTKPIKLNPHITFNHPLKSLSWFANIINIHIPQ